MLAVIHRCREQLPKSVILLLVSVAGFYAATVRAGNFWPDDYALYVHHAENIALGRAYSDTGYIYNAAVADYSPRSYPPVFPLLLAPVYRAFGLNLIAMKLEEVAFFILALTVIAFYWKRDLKSSYLFALIAILGYNPNFWVAKDAVVSDLPFLLFFYLTALVTELAPRFGPWRWGWATVTGALVYLCVGTRTVGITIMVGLVLFDIVKQRKITSFTAAAISVCFILLLLQRLWIGTGEQSYADQLHLTINTVWSNLQEYGRSLAALWPESLGHSASLLLFATTTMLAFVGGYFHFRDSFKAVDAFLIPYLTVVIVWPAPQGIRFLFPLIPFYVYLVLLAASRLPEVIPGIYAKSVFAIVILMVCALYGLRYRRAHYGTIPEADGLASFNRLCAFVRTQTKPSDVFVFRRSRAFSLFTSRSSAVYGPYDEKELIAFFKSIGASYIVSSGLFEDDRQFLTPFLQKNSRHLERLYENDDFQVFRIRDNFSDRNLARQRPASVETRNSDDIPATRSGSVLLQSSRLGGNDVRCSFVARAGWGVVTRVEVARRQVGFLRSAKLLCANRSGDSAVPRKATRTWASRQCHHGPEFWLPDCAGD